MKREYADYLLKKTKQDYNRIAQEFSSSRRFIWKDLEFLIQYTMPGDRVLDLGCGNGRLFQILKDMEIEYFGVDVSEKLIEIAKKRYHQAKFQVADALNLPFPNNYFDKIYSIAIFHHIPSEKFRLRFLKEAKRVLKPGGLLILTVWKIRQLKSIKLILKYSFLKILGLSQLDFGDILNPWGKKCKRYVHNFSQRGLRKLLEKSSFKIKEIDTIKRPERKDTNIYVVVEK